MIRRTLLFRNSRGSRGYFWLLGRPLAESVDVCYAGGQSFGAFIRRSTRRLLESAIQVIQKNCITLLGIQGRDLAITWLAFQHAVLAAKTCLLDSGPATCRLPL